MVKFVPFSFAMREFMFTFAIVMLTRLFFSVWLAMVAVGTCAQEVVQDEENLDEEAVDAMPSLDPMLKLGRVLDNGDSIQYVEVNPIYVYPKPVFKNAKQRQAYNRLVANVKKVLPIAKEVNVIIQETYEYLQTLPNKKAKDEHMKYVEIQAPHEETLLPARQVAHQVDIPRVQFFFLPTHPGIPGSREGGLLPGFRLGFWSEPHQEI